MAAPLGRASAAAWWRGLARSYASLAQQDVTAGASSAGAKARVFGLLEAQAEPRTAEELWQVAQEQQLGLRSKRFLKQMLAQMKAAGSVRTRPQGSKGYGYALAQPRKQVAGTFPADAAQPPGRASS